MNDRGASGIAKANTKNQLGRDADLQRKKSKIGKRSSASGLSSSSSSTGLGISSNISSLSGRNITRNNITKGTSSSSTRDAEAKKRIKREQQLNQVAKVADKLPVINKVAKAAKLAKKAEEIKAKKPSLMGFLGKTIGNMTKADQEAAIGADSRGEEYDPNDAEGQFTIKLDRKDKIILVSIIVGILISFVVVGIFSIAPTMDSEKEVYLASHQNPTEEEFEAAYNAQAGDERNGGTSGVNSGINQDSVGNIIMVGDSRTVGLCNSVYGISVTNCSTLGYKKGKNTFISLTSTAYDWFKSTALPEIKKQLNSNENSTVFINMGTNRLDDLTNQANSYAGDYNELAKSYPKANIVAISVTPIIDSKVSYFKNINLDSNVVKFNNQLKSKISSDVIYCDVYSKVKGKVDASDGVHYDVDSYKLINKEMLNCISGTSSSSSNSSLNSLLSKGGTSVSALNNNNIRQLVVVESSGTSANVSFYENTGSGWKLDSNLNSDGYVGRQGTSNSPSEGKAATPQGLYAVGDAFYQGSKPDTKLNTFKITSNTYWVDDPNSKYYNKRVEGTSNKDWSSAEHMSEISSYKYGFVIEYNTNPIKKGAGSAIFFHVSHNSPTAGCVSVSEDKVLAYLKKLDKSKNPYILII